MERVERNPRELVLNIPGSTNNGSRPRASKAPGVLVKDGVKAYGNRPPILANFNMNCPRGTIYALLGSSGCGKTTILSCIVGLRKLDAGEIRVCGAKPGTRESGIPGPRVGYMPQDIALYENLTIQEVLQYYGRIYGLSQEEIEKRKVYLMGFLELPDANRTVGTLSGGQQRRTSLAVSLVHQPELLILDEPTVGVDPLVREKIWDYLCNMVRTKNCTIIVTTHYIEEARQAHTVGLMRNGKLIVEKSPTVLLEEHNTLLLEDIVLKLCRKDNLGLIDKSDPSNEVTQALQEISFYSASKNLHVGGNQGKYADRPISGEKSPIVGLKFKRRFTEENMGGGGLDRAKSLKQRRQSVVEIVNEAAEEYFYSRGDRIRALVLRNYIQFFRNLVFVFAILCIPAIQVIIINCIIGYDPKNLDFGMVNHDVPPDNNGSFCPYDEGCNFDALSCRYVGTLPEDAVKMQRVDSKEKALEAVMDGKIWGFMEFPHNYSIHLNDRGLLRLNAENETIDGSTIGIRMDFSNYLGSSLLIRTFFESYQTFISKLLSDCGEPAGPFSLPIQYREPIYGSLSTGYQEFIAPAALIIIQFFVPLAAGGIAYIKDKKAGTLDRSRVAGVTNFDVVASYMISEGSIIVFQSIISFLILVFLFGVVIHGSSFLFLIMLLMTGVCGLSIGFIIAMLVDEEMEAVIITLGLYTPVLILSGIIWPLQGSDPIVLFISHCLPCTYTVEATRSIVSRGWGLSHPRVWPGLLMLIGWTFLSWVLIALVHKIRNK